MRVFGKLRQTLATIRNQPTQFGTYWSRNGKHTGKKPGKIPVRKMSDKIKRVPGTMQGKYSNINILPVALLKDPSTSHVNVLLIPIDLIQEAKSKDGLAFDMDTLKTLELIKNNREQIELFAKNLIETQSGTESMMNSNKDALKLIFDKGLEENDAALAHEMLLESFDEKLEAKENKLEVNDEKLELKGKDEKLEAKDEKLEAKDEISNNLDSNEASMLQFETQQNLDENSEQQIEEIDKKKPIFAMLPDDIEKNFKDLSIQGMKLAFEMDMTNIREILMGTYDKDQKSIVPMQRKGHEISLMTDIEMEPLTKDAKCVPLHLNATIQGLVYVDSKNFPKTEINKLDVGEFNEYVTAIAANLCSRALKKGFPTDVASVKKDPIEMKQIEYVADKDATANLEELTAAEDGDYMEELYNQLEQQPLELTESELKEENLVEDNQNQTLNLQNDQEEDVIIDIASKEYFDFPPQAKQWKKHFSIDPQAELARNEILPNEAMVQLAEALVKTESALKNDGIRINIPEFANRNFEFLLFGAYQKAKQEASYLRKQLMSQNQLSLSSKLEAGCGSSGPPMEAACPPKKPPCPPKKPECPKKPKCPKKPACPPKKPACPPKKASCPPKKPACPPKKPSCPPKKPACPPKKPACPKKPSCPPKKPSCPPKKPSCPPSPCGKKKPTAPKCPKKSPCGGGSKKPKPKSSKKDPKPKCNPCKKKTDGKPNPKMSCGPAFNGLCGPDDSKENFRKLSSYTSVFHENTRTGPMLTYPANIFAYFIRFFSISTFTTNSTTAIEYKPNLSSTSTSITEIQNNQPESLNSPTMNQSVPSCSSESDYDSNMAFRRRSSRRLAKISKAHKVEPRQKIRGFIGDLWAKYYSTKAQKIDKQKTEEFLKRLKEDDTRIGF